MSLPLFTAAFACWRATHELVAEAPVCKLPVEGVVKLSIKTVAGARTADTLGAEREGTGVVIGPDGLIVTIGYLVMEAESVLVITHDGRIFPAATVGFDQVTGFGLVRASMGGAVPSVALGNSCDLREFDQVHTVTHVAAGGASTAYLVSRRSFTGYWEYMIDEALFTAPPRFDHSGAALLDRDARLVGIGSLWVGDALDASVAFPGNMFVPIDLLKPVLDELVVSGRRRQPGRPWLGVYSDEIEGHVVLTRVLPDTPAADAGLRPGDVILGVAGQSVGSQSEFYRTLWAAGPAGEAVELHILRSKSVQHVTVRSVDRAAYLRARTAS